MTAHRRTLIATEQLNGGKIITDTEDYNCCRITSAVFWSDRFFFFQNTFRRVVGKYVDA